MFVNIRLPDEAKCHLCKRIFCCGACRQKHQLATHAIAVTRPLDASDRIAMAEARNDAAPASAISTTIYVFCPICEQKPLVLREDMYAELLDHIERVHLPLRCRKCLRQYSKINDLREFTRCVDAAQQCSSSTLQSNTCHTNDTRSTLKKNTVANTIATQTSPSVPSMNETQHLTPISLINLRWKAKSKLAQEEFSGDSVSSIKNLSTYSNSSAQLSIGQQSAPAAKLIRSTSTPLQVDTVFAKPKEPITFNASNGGHMSSIYHSGYVDPDHNSPAVLPADNSAQQPQQLQQRTWKVNARNKMSAVTPLRQVMSKSIQKAFVVHGGIMPSANEVVQRRTRLDLSDNNSSLTESGSCPLDLRLSPAIRRTQSETSTTECSVRSHRDAHIPKYQQQILLSAQKLTTESIIITRTQLQSSNSAAAQGENSSSNVLHSLAGSTAGGATVYNSCESVEIITATTELSTVDCNMMPPITPITRVPGATISKKLIKFETPQKNETTNAHVKVVPGETPSMQEIEEFYTPNPSTPDHEKHNERRRPPIVPRQLSGQFSPDKKHAWAGPRARPPLRLCNEHESFSGVQTIAVIRNNTDDEDEVFLPTSASTQNDKQRKSSQQQGASRLWSLMTSVMRLPSTLIGDNSASCSDKENNGGRSILKRCASIAGSLVRSRPEEAAIQNLKRKRTQTLDNHYTNPYCHGHDASSPSCSSKRLRIQPRRPIERMRK